MCRFSKSCLMVFLMAFIVLSSCSALAFLPSYSTSSGKEGTGLLSLLQSFTSAKSETSSTQEDEATVPTIPEGKKKDGYICYTEAEVKEMDKALAKVEKALADELRPVHFGLGASVGYRALTTLEPEIDMHLRWDNFIVNWGVSYPFDVTMKPEDITFDISKLSAKVGFMYEW